MGSTTHRRLPFALRLAAATFLAPFVGLGSLMAVILGLGAALIGLGLLMSLLRQLGA